jgi:hypothetical protein
MRQVLAAWAACAPLEGLAAHQQQQLARTVALQFTAISSHMQAAHGQGL